jgi:hypothetical protein
MIAACSRGSTYDTLCSHGASSTPRPIVDRGTWECNETMSAFKAHSPVIFRPIHHH